MHVSSTLSAYYVCGMGFYILHVSGLNCSVSMQAYDSVAFHDDPVLDTLSHGCNWWSLQVKPTIARLASLLASKRNVSTLACCTALSFSLLQSAITHTQASRQHVWITWKSDYFFCKARVTHIPSRKDDGEAQHELITCPPDEHQRAPIHAIYINCVVLLDKLL